MAEISGNTYPVRERLKALGGVWNPEKKVWIVPDERAEAARAIVAAGPVGTRRREPVYWRCQVCGAKRTRYNPIYRSGECRDCYEERKMGY